MTTAPTPSVKARKSLTYISDSLQYYPHQIDGIRSLARRSSFLLADEMGLGKSLQALTVAAVDFEKGWARRVLVVAPATLKGNWYDEIEKHTSFNAVVLDGTPKKRSKIMEAFYQGIPLDDDEESESKDWHILIVNYEQVMAHLDELNRLKFDIIIYDEGHYLKNPKAKRTRACQALRAKRHFVLTGSPMLNHVNDLWSLLHRIDPIEFPNYYRFINRYCIFGGYKDKQIVGVKNGAELRERLGDYMLRRRKQDVLDLPDKQNVPVYVDLHPQQRKLYSEVNDQMQLTIPSQPSPQDIENALVKFTRLKEICGTTAAIDGYDDKSHKLDRAVEMIEEITQEQGENVVVFTQFRAVLRCLEERIQASKTLDVPVWAIHGDVPVEQRVPRVNEWANSSQPGVLALMLQVGGVGLNLTAANKCIFLDKLFSPKMNEQAEDRLHRIGASATQPIQIYEIIARNTIEQRIEQILKRKSHVFGEIVDTTELKRKLIEALKQQEED